MMREKFLFEKFEKGASNYARKYEKYVEKFATDSPLSKVRKVSNADIIGLCEQLDAFSEYKQYVNENGGVNDLGRLPDIAYDVITASYGSSIVPLLCSTQPLEDERGTIFYKETVISKNAKGQNVFQNGSSALNLQDVLSSGQGGSNIVYPYGLAGNEVNFTSPALTNGGTDVVNVGVALRKFSVKIEVYTGTTLVARLVDDGEGGLLSNSKDIAGNGTPHINYSTGAIGLANDFSSGTNTVVVKALSVEAEETGEISTITTVTKSTEIFAEIFTLATETSLFKNFSMKKRFGGKLSEEDLIQDLTNEMTAEISNTVVKRMLTSLGNTPAVTWDAVPPSGNYSVSEHNLELKDKLMELDADVYAKLKRGNINILVAGIKASAKLGRLPNFAPSNISVHGSHVFGTLDNMLVIRSPIVPTDRIIGISKGNGVLESPVVYAPYMPLFVTSTMPSNSNPLMKMHVAGVWAGVKVVLPNSMSLLKIDNL